MEIDQSITRIIEPEKEKTPVTNQGDTTLMSVGKILIFSSVSYNSFISFFLQLFVTLQMLPLQTVHQNNLNII